MRVVVAGGSGLIGRALVGSLLADGHEVTVLTRDPDRARKRLPAGCEIRNGTVAVIRRPRSTSRASTSL